MPYRFIDHTADIAVEIEGATLNELFASACFAWRESVLQNHSIKNESSKKFIFNSTSLEVLLIDLLNELNFQLSTKKWVFNSIKELLLQEFNSSFQLEVEFLGQHFDSNIHILKEEIKAVTFHQMKIEKVNNSYKTMLVFDI